MFGCSGVWPSAVTQVLAVPACLLGWAFCSRAQSGRPACPPRRLSPPPSAPIAVRSGGGCGAGGCPAAGGGGAAARCGCCARGDHVLGATHRASWHRPRLGRGDDGGGGRVHRRRHGPPGRRAQAQGALGGAEWLDGGQGWAAAGAASCGWVGVCPLALWCQPSVPCCRLAVKAEGRTRAARQPQRTCSAAGGRYALPEQGCFGVGSQNKWPTLSPLNVLSVLAEVPLLLRRCTP